jgi:hypothetical protein
MFGPNFFRFLFPPMVRKTAVYGITVCFHFLFSCPTVLIFKYSPMGVGIDLLNLFYNEVGAIFDLPC